MGAMIIRFDDSMPVDRPVRTVIERSGLPTILALADRLP